MSQLPFALPFVVLMVAGWINRRQQLAIDYLLEENRVLREQLGNRRLRLTDAQRRRLAVRGKLLGRELLEELAGPVRPETILRWYRTLVARKYDGSKNRGRGRPETPPDLTAMILRMAEENPRWGYTRIRGELFALGHTIARSTIQRILATHGIEPAPERGRKMRWRTFLKAQWEVIAAADFFTVEVPHCARVGQVQRLLRHQAEDPQGPHRRDLAVPDRGVDEADRAQPTIATPRSADRRTGRTHGLSLGRPSALDLRPPQP